MATETAVDVVMPQMGVSVSEGTITKWLKREGEQVEADEPLLEISTDKVDTEVPSPGSGTVTQILVQEGETVAVGTKLAQIGGAPSGDGAAPPAGEAPPEPATQQAADASMAAASEGVGDVTPSAPPEREPAEAATTNGKTFVSPVVARIASEHGVDPNQVQGTGRGGRVTKKDILEFIESAVVETLREYPWVNGEIRGDQIVTRNYVNLGFAVELADGKGLIVPVVKNAEGLNLLGIARSVADVARRAREKQLTPDDVTGGTFTITNPGGYGTFHGTPVISQPQAAILGTYAVVKRPWVVQDELGEDVIAIRPIMNLTLTYDHRLVDGALAGRFLRDLREKLETWDESAY